MGQKFDHDIFGTRQTPLSSSTPTPGLYIHQSTGATTQISADVQWRPPDVIVLQSTGTTQIPVDEQLSGADVIKRLSTLENKFKQLEGLFGVSTVYINTLGDENWELKQPLHIAVEQRSSEDFTACLYDVDLYGYGESIPEALEDLKLVIVNQYEYLLQQKDKTELGKPLKKQFEFLNNILVSLNA